MLPKKDKMYNHPSPLLEKEGNCWFSPW